MLKPAPAGRTVFEVEFAQSFAALVLDQERAGAHRTDDSLINRDYIKVDQTANQFAGALGCPGLKQSPRHVLAQKENERRDRAQQLREIFRRKTLDAEQRAGTGGLIALHPSERAGLAENVAPAKNRSEERRVGKGGRARG